MKLFGRTVPGAKRIIVLLLLGCCWFLRDQFAVSLEKDSDLAQKAMDAAAVQKQAEAQNRDQREMLARLKNLENVLAADNANVQKDEAAAEKELEAEVKRDGIDLQQQAKSLSKLKGQLTEAGMVDSLKDEEKTKLDAAIKDAGDAGQEQVGWAEGKIDNHSQDALTEADDDAAKADNELSSAYTVLTENAEKERQSSDSAARGFRFLAWFATALAALLSGDWRKLFGMFTGGDEGDTTSDEETAPVGAKG